MKNIYKDQKVVVGATIKLSLHNLSPMIAEVVHKDKLQLTNQEFLVVNYNGEPMFISPAEVKSCSVCYK